MLVTTSAHGLIQVNAELPNKLYTEILLVHTQIYNLVTVESISVLPRPSTLLLSFLPHASDYIV